MYSPRGIQTPPIQSPAWVGKAEEAWSVTLNPPPCLPLRNKLDSF